MRQAAEAGRPPARGRPAGGSVQAGALVRSRPVWCGAGRRGTGQAGGRLRAGRRVGAEQAGLVWSRPAGSRLAGSRPAQSMPACCGEGAWEVWGH